MLKEFKIPHRSDQMYYRIGKDMPFVPYTEDMRKMDKLKAKMIREDISYLFQKSPIEDIVEDTTSTIEGEDQMIQDCCKYYDNLVPFSCRHRHIDKWDLLWKCSVCGQWYKIDFDTSTMTPRIKNVQEVDPSMYFDTIEHERLDIFQIRNIQSGVPILEPDRQAVANFEVTRKHNWMCPNCTYGPEVTLSDEGNIFTCRDCGNTYKLWTNQDTKMVSYINLNKPKTLSPVVVETPEEEDTSHMENIEEPTVSEINESQEEIVQDTVVEETIVNETTEETTPEHVVVNDTSEASTVPVKEYLPDEDDDLNSERLDYHMTITPVTTDISAPRLPEVEEGILISRGIPDWMCDHCLENYNDVTLVDFYNTSGYRCNVCGTIYYIERVGDEQDIVYRRFKQITPEEMTSMYVTTDTISKIVDETEEGGVLDTIMDKVMEDVLSSETKEIKWDRDDIGEDIDPKDFVSIDDEVEEPTVPVISEEISLDIEDDTPVVVDEISIDTPVVKEIKSDHYLHITPDPINTTNVIAEDGDIFNSEDIDPDFSLDEEEMEHYYHTQSLREDPIEDEDSDGGVYHTEEYHVHVNLPKGIQNMIVDDNVIKEMANDAMASIFDKKESYPTTIVSGTVEDSTKFQTVKSPICERSSTQIHKYEEYHTLDFVVSNESKRLSGMVKIYNNDTYTFKVESFSVRMLSAKDDDVFDAPKTHTLDIADPLAGELGSWDAMVYELKLISGENFYVYIDMAMLSKVTVGFK